MSPRQIEAYLRSPDASRPTMILSGWGYEPRPGPITCRRSDAAAYALGIRYLRDEKWDLAER